MFFTNERFFEIMSNFWHETIASDQSWINYKCNCN